MAATPRHLPQTWILAIALAGGFALSYWGFARADETAPDEPDEAAAEVVVAVEAVVDSASPARPAISADDADFFERKVRPLLVARCYECHSREAKIVKGGLYLDSRDGWMTGGNSGPAIVPGDVDGSLVMSAVRYESYEMPPSGQLPASEIAVLEEWIKRGAPDPRDEVARADVGRPDASDAAEFWALQPISNPTPPATANERWPRTDVDRFILARLEAAGITPARDADRRTLVRRLYFDLIGLPPTPDEVEDFVRDASDGALERVVDRLLADPGFGVRWGRHWLDVARYADSNGLDENFTFYDAWRYRNYVIGAVNADKPFDRFLTEQIAGDLLPWTTQEERDENVTATGFLVVGPKVIGALDKVQLEMDVVDEQIDTLGKAVLGLTLGCARCHDHKFDPISTRDYYALAGIFTSTETLHGQLLQRPDLSGWNLQPLGDRGRTLHDAYSAHDNEVYKRTVEQRRLKIKRDAIDLIRKGEAKLSDYGRDEDPDFDPEAELKRIDERNAELEKELAELRTSYPPRPPMAMGVNDRATIGPTQICIRGDAHNRGETVPRGFVSVVEPAAPEISAESSGRLELAQWLTDAQNPLTSRVAVNRVWAHLFGAGLVRTVDNFGVQGERPSHPELLDHLAQQFMRDGWSLKRLVRTLVLSRTYQLSTQVDESAAAIDPENRLLWRMNRRRLDVEALRDGLLAISGQLDRTPAESTVAHLTVQATGVGIGPRQIIPSVRRSIYLPVIRNDLTPMFQAFDFADPQIVVGQRNRTIVASQALELMNGPLAIEAAAHTAERLLENGERVHDEDRLDRLFTLVLNRLPAPHEVEPALDLLDAARLETGCEACRCAAVESRAWAVVCHALFCSTEFQFLD